MPRLDRAAPPSRRLARGGTCHPLLRAGLDRAPAVEPRSPSDREGTPRPDPRVLAGPRAARKTRLTAAAGQGMLPRMSSLDVRSIEQEALDLTRELCRKPSVSAEERALGETAELVATLLTGAGFETKLLAVDGAPPAVYGELADDGNASLLLYNHYSPARRPDRALGFTAVRADAAGRPALRARRSRQQGRDRRPAGNHPRP